MGKMVNSEDTRGGTPRPLLPLSFMGGAAMLPIFTIIPKFITESYATGDSLFESSSFFSLRIHSA